MEFFTGLGVFIVTLVVLILGYAIGFIIVNGNDYLSPCLIIFSVSMMVTTFVMHPESYGYQRINTVSECEVEEE